LPFASCAKIKHTGQAARRTADERPEKSADSDIASRAAALFFYLPHQEKGGDVDQHKIPKKQICVRVNKPADDNRPFLMFCAGFPPGADYILSKTDAHGKKVSKRKFLKSAVKKLTFISYMRNT
jgi:hypothetical protein